MYSTCEFFFHLLYLLLCRTISPASPSILYYKVSYRPRLCRRPCPNINSGWKCRIPSSDSWKGSLTSRPPLQTKQNRVHPNNIEASWLRTDLDNYSPSKNCLWWSLGRWNTTSRCALSSNSLQPSLIFFMIDIKVWWTCGCKCVGTFGYIKHLGVVQTGKKKKYCCSNFCFYCKHHKKETSDMLH